MKSRYARLALAGLVGFISVAAASCGNDSPTAPTPTLATETFTGTISPLEVKSHTFTIDYTGFSDASVTVTSLVTVADGTARPITIGVGFGTLSVGVCTRAAAYTNPAAPLNQELPTTGSAFSSGPYCVSIFDNLDGPTVTEPLTYTMVVKHY